MIGPVLLALVAADAGQGYRTGVSWDAEAQAAYAFVNVPRVRDRFFVRGRAGLIWAREPWFVMAGATIEAFSIPKLAGGLQVSVTHLERGVWAQTGASISGAPDVFFHLAAGFTIFGFEWQRRLDGPGDAWLFLIKIPVGLFFFAR